MSDIEAISREDLEASKAWLAGFIDGEGCFYLGFNTAYDRKTPRKTLRTIIFIGNTEAEPLVRVSEVLKTLGVGFSSTFTRSKKEKWRDSIAIKICGQGRCLKLSRLLMPYLTCKREQAKQMINAIEYRRELAKKYGGNNKNSRLIDDPVLQAMAQRMKDLHWFQHDLSKLSRKPGEVLHFKKPSQTIRLGAISAHDIVGPAWGHAEAGRNDQPAAELR